MANTAQPKMNRRTFVARTAATAGVSLLPITGPVTSALAVQGSGPLKIGSRRELFVGEGLLDGVGGSAKLQLHHPQPQEIVLVHDEPWEGSGAGYHSIFQDGDLYRMYYKAWHLAVSKGKVNTGTHPLYCCYAESTDGIHWRKPELGLVEFGGAKYNNIVISSGRMGALEIDAGHPAVFKDENPAASADARYKAIVRCAKPHGLAALKSPDGLHWSLLSETAIITNGAFDSQNLAFWDPVQRRYRAYWRIFTEGVTTEKSWKPAGIRAIRTATSEDLLHWSEPEDLTYIDSPAEQLYTNQVKPYYRAPHILVGFPARYVERGWSPSMRALPELEHREWRAEATLRYGTALSESLFMASRDGVRFERWNEAFLRPGVERPGTWNYGQQYIGWHLVETKSKLPGAPNELSLYATESYWTGNSSELRRYTLRLDGFVSVSSPRSTGYAVTRPLIFQGNELHLNFSTSAIGWLKVELQEVGGKPIPGFTEAEADETFGDTVDRAVSWKGATNVSALAGRPVRLRFSLSDADVYAFQFVQG